MLSLTMALVYASSGLGALHATPETAETTADFAAWMERRLEGTQDGSQERIGALKQETNLEIRERLHKPDQFGTPAADRLASYEDRLQMVAESRFRNVPWRNIGPTRQGGRVVQFTTAQDGREWFVAFATGGLWRSETHGQTWTPLFDSESSFGIGDFASSPDGTTLWVGAGEANNQRTSYSGTGIFKSTDRGETWRNMGLHESHHIGRVLIHPHSPDTVFVASVGHLYSQDDERGLYKTTDGGETWRHVLAIDDRTGVIDVVMHRNAPNIMLASAYERDRRTWNFLESGPGSALYRSTDGGETWNKVEGFPSGIAMGRTGLYFAPSNQNRVYAFVDNRAMDPNTIYRDEFVPSGELSVRKLQRMPMEVMANVDKAELVRLFVRFTSRDNANQWADKIIAEEMTAEELRGNLEAAGANAFREDIYDAQVWRSDDAGATWENVSVRMGSHGGYYWNKIIVAPDDEDEVYSLGVILLRSRDGGVSWERIASGNHVDHHALYIEPTNPNLMFDGNDGGMYISYDRGETWSHNNNLPVGQFTTIAVDMKTPYNVYGGTQDNGTMRGPSTGRPGPGMYDPWTTLGGGDGSAIAVDPRGGGDIVYVASQFGGHVFVNQVTGERRSAANRAGPGQEPLRYNWISPLIISKHHPDVIYLGSQKLHRSFDQARTYHDLSGDLTKNLPMGNVPYGTLTVIDESPFRFGLLYIGADDGSLKMTHTSGHEWLDIQTPETDRWVTRIVASAFSESRVYVTQNGYRQDDFRPMVWRSDDYGQTWTSIIGNLPLECVNTIREDPDREDVLYVGTDMGVYVTFNNGDTWEPLGKDLPHTPVHDLVIHPRERELVIASHARSVWIADVTKIKDLTAEIMAAPVHLYPLETIRNAGRWQYQSRPPYADSDPANPQVNGVVWTAIGGTAKIRLLNAEGEAVREMEAEFDKGFNSYSIGLLLSPGSRVIERVIPPPANAEEALADPYEQHRPQYVPPGEYEVEITIGGHTEKVTLVLQEA